MSAKERARKRLRLPVSGQIAVASAVAIAAKRAYAGAYRRELIAHGFRDRAVVIRRQEVHRALNAHGAAIALSVIATYNAMLNETINDIPNDAGDDEVKKRLLPFLTGVFLWNRAVLTPYTVRWSTAQAVHDFYWRNAIASTDASRDSCQWTLDPDSTAGVGDSCDVALAASPMSSEESLQYSLPAHRHCPHILVAINVMKLPAERQLWLP